MIPLCAKFPRANTRFAVLSILRVEKPPESNDPSDNDGSESTVLVQPSRAMY
jgi:hypothetical protein